MDKFYIYQSIHDLTESNILDETLIYSDEFALNEGLITTWPLEKTISVLRSSKFNVHPMKNNTFKLVLSSYQRLNKAITLASNLGWFPSYVETFVGDVRVDRDKYNASTVESMFDDVETASITFEAKYDIAVHDVPKYLYHLAPRNVAAKILKFGLSPKSKSAVSSHPPRVYLGKTKHDVLLLLKRMAFVVKSIDGKFWLLKINTNLIPAYFMVLNSVQRDNKLYSDPNFLDKGLYTLNTIPPSAIEFEEEIDGNSYFRGQ